MSQAEVAMSPFCVDEDTVAQRGEVIFLVPSAMYTVDQKVS